MRESYAVNTLSRVVQDKDYNEIDSLFQYSLVTKQENEILALVPAHLVSGTGDQELSEEAMSHLNESQLTDLKELRERK